jgi:UDP-N-acetylglucosamine--N-acetylmuramyl-(pentapeptide) pyrophosphoryl-undecaprenol N-acetylglucosamine transferase
VVLNVVPARRRPPADRPVLLAGGGTAGHLAPGFALRSALAAHGVRCAFVTPGEEKERAWFPEGEAEPLHVAAPRLPRSAVPAAAFPLRMGASVAWALAVLRRERPGAVVALGGWPCAPVALAALLARVPLHLVAVDAVPGVVVRSLSRFAARTYLASGEARGALPRPDRAVVVGPFLRPDLAAARRDPARFGLAPGVPTLLVVGGSLGASALNGAVLAGLTVAAAADPSLASRVQVIHSTGPEGEATAKTAYDRLGVRAFVAPFVAAMPDALATADLVLCRGGASTLAEVRALARPAVVVPYPHHVDRQQERNAEPLVRAGLATVVDQAELTPAAFGTVVLARLLDPRRGPGASAASSGAAGGGGAAAAAADLVRSLGGGNRGS